MRESRHLTTTLRELPTSPSTHEIDADAASEGDDWQSVASSDMAPDDGHDDDLGEAHEFGTPPAQAPPVRSPCGAPANQQQGFQSTVDHCVYITTANCLLTTLDGIFAVPDADKIDALIKSLQVTQPVRPSTTSRTKAP